MSYSIVLYPNDSLHTFATISMNGLACDTQTHQFVASKSSTSNIQLDIQDSISDSIDNVIHMSNQHVIKNIKNDLSTENIQYQHDDGCSVLSFHSIVRRIVDDIYGIILHSTTLNNITISSAELAIVLPNHNVNDIVIQGDDIYHIEYNGMYLHHNDTIAYGVKVNSPQINQICYSGIQKVTI